MQNPNVKDRKKWRVKYQDEYKGGGAEGMLNEKSEGGRLLYRLRIR